MSSEDFIEHWNIHTYNRKFIIQTSRYKIYTTDRALKCPIPINLDRSSPRTRMWNMPESALFIYFNTLFLLYHFSILIDTGLKTSQALLTEFMRYKPFQMDFGIHDKGSGEVECYLEIRKQNFLIKTPDS